jgi:class 3 adenylate cyclase/tetratricopeptide (TPR) repeat protein
VLRIRVLGELTLELDGRELPPPPSRRARSLLGFLAVDRRAHSRTQLASRFWPDVLDESARTSLRSALSALRRALGPDADRYLVATRDTVRLAGEDLVWTDITEFERALAGGDVEEALELARGDLLHGLDDEWVYERRDEHRDRVGATLERLAAQAEERGDLPAAIGLTRRRVGLDPLAEEAHRELIRRLAAGGDRSGALAAYRRLQDRLRDDLGIAPSAPTRALVESLRADEGERAPPPERPRRPTGTVTLLFTDQASSTETLQRLGDDEAERLRRAHFRLLRDVAAAHGGEEVKNLGDGLMVAFASAVDAVAAAIGMQQAVQRHAERIGDDRLAVRVGLNVGEPILDEDDYFGTPVVVAKRLCDAAASGQILASDLVRALVGTRGGFDFRAVGPLSLKGIAEPLPACEIAWTPTTEQLIPLPPAVERAVSTPLVGRDDALRQLREHWQKVRAGDPAVVALAGEPGIGKTRLASEFCRAARDEGAAVLAGRCYEEALAPYQPFVEALRTYVATCPPVELTLQVASHRHALAPLIPELADGAGRAASDDGGTDQRRYRLFEAVTAFINEAAAARPLILVLDDLHWADEATLLLLRHLGRSVAAAEVMVLVTYRATELDPQGNLAAALAELRRARRLHELALSGLGPADVATLVRAQAGQAASDSFARRVAERTNGNPLFVEELLRYVDEPTVAHLEEHALPTTIKDLLVRRLARLDEEPRAALDTAAVVGTEFELALLARVLDRPDDALAEMLERAARAHVVAEDTSMVGRYRFAHPLIREAVYGELSMTRRALVHRRIGEALEGLHADDLEAHADDLARHFRAGGDAAKAYRYHSRAAEAAQRVYAIDTAFEHLNGAIDSAAALGLRPESEPRLRDLYRRRAWAQRFAAGMLSDDAAIADYEVSLEAARTAGDRRLEMLVLNELGTVFHVRDSAAAVRHHERSLALAEELGDEGGQVAALGRLALAHGNQLDLERALELGDRALLIAERGGDEPTVARALDCLKFAALMLGDAQRLEDLASRLAAIQRERQELWFLAWTLEESAFAPIVRGDLEEGARRLEEALAISRRIDDRRVGQLIRASQCRLARCRGEYAQAIALGEEAMRLTDGSGRGRVPARRAETHLWLGWTAATLATALADLRQWEAVVEVLETGLHAVDRIDARAQIFSCLGPLAWARLRSGDHAGAGAAARRWDALAQEIRVPPGQAYLYARDSYTSRARVALATGERDRARSILNGVAGPVERFGIRDGAGDVYALLAECADDGDEAVRLLERGLELVAGRDFPADRLRLHLGLATAAPAEAARAHARAARALVDEIATSTADQDVAAAFRAAALDELDATAAATS